MVGANYITAEEEIAFGNPQKGMGFQLAGAYTLHENLRLSAGTSASNTKVPSGPARPTSPSRATRSMATSATSRRRSASRRHADPVHARMTAMPRTFIAASATAFASLIPPSA
jgi:hypothetical protein